MSKLNIYSSAKKVLSNNKVRIVALTVSVILISTAQACMSNGGNRSQSNKSNKQLNNSQVVEDFSDKINYIMKKSK